MWLGASTLFGIPQTATAPPGSELALTGASTTVPRLIKFNGVLKGTANQPQAEVVAVNFALYELQQGGFPLWTELQRINLDEQRRYTVLLGATQPGGLPLDLFTSGKALWLGIEPQTPSAVEQPRVLLVAVPYALKAADADTLGGKPASAYALAGSVTAAAGTLAAATNTVQAGGSSRRVEGTASPQVLQPCAGVTSDGTATANSIAKFTTACNVQSSNLTDTGTKFGLFLTTPTYDFDLSKSQNQDTVFRVRNNNSGASARANLRLEADSAIFSVIAQSVANGKALLFQGQNDNNLAFQQVSNAPITFFTNNVERVRFAGNGNVGIGTTNPTANLEVAGNLKVSGAGHGITYPDGSTQTSAAALGTVTSVGNGTGLTGGPITTSGSLSIDHTVVAFLADVAAETTRATAAESTKVAKTGDTMTGTLGLLSGASLGIGTGTPVNYLEIKNNDTQQVGIDLNNTSTGGTDWRMQSVGSGIAGRVGNYEFLNFATGQTAMAIAPNANVGIGTTTPSALLEVNGTAKFDQPVVFASSQTFPGGTITGTTTISTGNLGLPATTADGANGVINLGGSPFITACCPTSLFNTFVGANAGGFAANSTFSGGFGANTALGYHALQSLTSGTSNIAIGASSLNSDTSGTENTAVGFQTLYYTTTGSNNTAIGFDSLRSNATGISNTALGHESLYSNNTGNFNTATGFVALEVNTSGAYNSALGYIALGNNTTGNNNTAGGVNALLTNTTGNNNTALGYGADVASANLTNATAIGANAIVGESNAVVLGGTGQNAVKVGIGNTTPTYTLDVNGTANFSGMVTFAAGATQTGTQTINNGNLVLPQTTGSAAGVITLGSTPFVQACCSASAQNSFIGSGAGNFTTTASSNTAVGYHALINITTGGQNTAVGVTAGQTIKTGFGDTFLGNSADASTTALSNASAIGYNAKVTASDSLVLGGTYVDGQSVTHTTNVGIGTGSPNAPLNVVTAASKAFEIDGSSTSGTILNLSNTSTGGTLWSLVATGSSSPEGAGRLVFRANGLDPLSIHPSGQLGIGVGAPAAGRQIDTSSGAYLSLGGTWTNASDRNLKEHFAPVDGKAVLQRLRTLPIERWNYKREGAAVEHIGPMAQDFFAAFRLGPDDKHISTIDEGGIALAGIQELYLQLERKEVEIRQLQARVDELEKVNARTAELEARLARLEKK
jgi:hypothetical protein